MMDWERLIANGQPARVGRPAPFLARRWGQRVSLVFFLSLTIVLILMSKSENGLVDKARIAAQDMMAPVLVALSIPAKAARDEIAGISDMLDVHDRNRQLAEDNRRLREWQALARHLQSENARLRAELGYVDEEPRKFVTARVVADGSGAFARSLLINAGAREAVDRDLPVIANGALVGRVVLVGSRSARVLLLTDLNSRIPVTVGEYGERAILAGKNSSELTLEYLDEGTAAAVGDRVATSGHGGIFPPGLAVGMVTRIDDGAIAVEPAIDYATLGHVRVLQMVPITLPDAPRGVADDPPLSASAPRPDASAAP